MIQNPSSKPSALIGRGPVSLIAGATYPFRALWLFIKTPRLRSYILAPILVNLVLGVTVYAGLLFGGMQAIDTLLSNLPVWTAELSQEASSLTATSPIGNLSLPDWHLSLPGWLPALPSWQIHLPNWLTNIQIRVPDWLPNWQIQLPEWVSRLDDWGFAVFVWFLRLILTLVLLVITGFIFLQFGVLLGSPWYGKLSEEIERTRTGQMFLVEVNPITEVGRAISYELNKLALIISVTVLLLLFNFLPGIGTAIASFAGIALAETITCMDFLDAAVERRRPRFRQKLGIVFRSLPASASFGLVCLGLVSIPFVNLLAIPICVAAGTLFFCDRILPELKDRDGYKTEHS
ncbi:MAG: hypothetical protein Kow00121_34860 [Elainellaceae cyanobacterium]